MCWSTCAIAGTACSAPRSRAWGIHASRPAPSGLADRLRGLFEAGQRAIQHRRSRWVAGTSHPPAPSPTRPATARPPMCCRPRQPRACPRRWYAARRQAHRSGLKVSRSARVTGGFRVRRLGTAGSAPAPRRYERPRSASPRMPNPVPRRRRPHRHARSPTRAARPSRRPPSGSSGRARRRIGRAGLRPGLLSSTCSAFPRTSRHRSTAPSSRSSPRRVRRSSTGRRSRSSRPRPRRPRDRRGMGAARLRTG